MNIIEILWNCFAGAWIQYLYLSVTQWLSCVGGFIPTSRVGTAWVQRSQSSQLQQSCRHNGTHQAGHSLRNFLAPEKMLIFTNYSCTHFLTTSEVEWYFRLCLSVCQMITFKSVDTEVRIHTCGKNLQAIRVMFVYEGHRVKVKVTGAKRSKIHISAITSICSNITRVL